jgi:hypothetical protein
MELFLAHVVMVHIAMIVSLVGISAYIGALVSKAIHVKAKMRMGK